MCQSSYTSNAKPKAAHAWNCGKLSTFRFRWNLTTRRSFCLSALALKLWVSLVGLNETSDWKLNHSDAPISHDFGHKMHSTLRCLFTRSEMRLNGNLRVPREPCDLKNSLFFWFFLAWIFSLLLSHLQLDVPLKHWDFSHWKSGILFLFTAGNKQKGFFWVGFVFYGTPKREGDKDASFSFRSVSFRVSAATWKPTPPIERTHQPERFKSLTLNQYLEGSTVCTQVR